MLKHRKLGRGVALVGAGITKFGVYPHEVRAADLFAESFLDMKKSVNKGLMIGILKLYTSATTQATCLRVRCILPPRS